MTNPYNDSPANALVRIGSYNCFFERRQRGGEFDELFTRRDFLIMALNEERDEESFARLVKRVNRFTDELDEFF